MKKLFFPILAAGVLLSCTKGNAQKDRDEDTNRHYRNNYKDKPETHREVIKQEFTVSPNASLMVYNIFGDIKVEGYSGKEVVVEVEKIIKAESKSDVELALKEVKLGFDQQQNDTLTFYTAEPYDSRPRTKWSYDWSDDDEKKKRRDYIVHLNYTIKVPRGMALRVSTVDNGEIAVNDFDGLIKANNVNGGITLKNIKAAHDVHTINGDVLINFLASPPENSKFYTLNGKLDITLPKDFSADCEFKSFNGNFYTDFDGIEPLPAKVEKKVKQGEKGTTYKLSKIHAYRFGKGGKNIQIETFNGNAYLRKQS